jgi:hypothetical protein
MILACASGAIAQAPAPAPSAPGGWSYIVEPYLLAPSMSGTAGVRGLTSEVDASAGDIVGALDMGAMLYLEARNPKWAFSLDATYMDLGASGTTRLGGVDLDLKQTGITAAGYRRLAPWAEAMLGLTFNSISGSLKGTGPVAENRSDDQNWVDPYLGVRLAAPADKWRFGFFGAIGGFGIGSDFAWQAFPEVGYRFNRLFELTGGYRAVGMDYSNDSENGEFVYDLITSGPQLGAKFHF